MTISEVFKDEKAPAVALLMCYLNKYGDEPEAINWDSTTIWHEIKKDFGIELSEFQLDKLNAALTILMTDYYEVNWHVYELCSHLLSNVHADSSVVSPLEVEEIVKSSVDAHLIKHESIKYSDDVNVYVGKIFYDYGFSKPPTLFPSAILPTCNQVDDEEKNKALQELFDHRLNFVMEYVEKIDF